MAYLTVAEYRAYLAALTSGNPTYTEPADTTFQQGLLDAATTFIEEQTMRRFSAATVTRKYGPEAVPFGDSQLLMLDDDLLTVTTLTNGDGVVIASNKYDLWPRNLLPAYAIRLRSTATWAWPVDSTVSVAGTWGLMATPNADVKRIAARLAYLEQQRRTNTGEVLVMQGAMQYSARVPDDVSRWLADHTRRRVL